MTNFSSFFPVVGAGGGGGFTKMNKYSTLNALADADVRQGGSSAIRAHPSQRSGSSLASGSTRVTFYTEGWASTLSAAQLVGVTFVSGSTTHTVTSRDNNDSGRLNISFTPALATSMSGNQSITFTSPSAITVNPATDLGLEDGASLGYFMVGAGDTTTSGNLGSMGGKIIQGTKIISNASTDLVLTPGVGANTASTISGGLTITTANGSNRSGSAHYRSTTGMSVGNGINGYGQGSVGTDLASYAEQTSPTHGFGSGTTGSTASDGAILLFY